MSTPADRLRRLLSPVVEAAGCDLEDVSVAAAGRRSVVRVLVDRDGGVDLDAVAEISRLVSAALDDADTAEPGLLGGAYTLEVGSPGVSRPLTEPRHWRRNIGRLVIASLTDGTSLTGRVAAADDERVVLVVDGAPRPVELDRLRRGVVQVEFARSAEREEAP